jgi:hypothetical protein
LEQRGLSSSALFFTEPCAPAEQFGSLETLDFEALEINMLNA